MHWKIKAAAQNAIALLPQSLSYAAYYRIQRLIGGLRNVNPFDTLDAGVQTWTRITQEGRDPIGKTFFEVGTGRTPDIPLAYWLMGAKCTITIDVNPYLTRELVRESLCYIYAHQQEIRRLFGDLLQHKRMEALLGLCQAREFSLTEFLHLCRIDYIGGGDAARTGFPSGSVDFHTSHYVFEHIHPQVLLRILEEGNRIISDDGLFVHRVDYSDHFSHSDATISSINFLQYSDAEWTKYAGNRYMYMNRLRHDDVLAVFQNADHRILSASPVVDERSLELLRGGLFRLNERFATKSPEALSIRESWIVSCALNSSR